MRKIIGPALFTLFVPALAFGCSDSHGRNDDGGAALDAGRVDDGGRGDTGVLGCTLPTPARHRAGADACPTERGTPTIEGTPEDWWDCRSHDECTEGINGRCTWIGRGGYYCTYDQCFADAECDSGPCICRGTTGGTAAAGANRCFPGGCRTDADCGVGGFCSPTYGSCGDYGGTAGYYCHTCDDDCTDDADCTAPGAYCAYDLVEARWHCQATHCDG